MEFSYDTQENDQKRAPVPRKSTFWIIAFILTWCMHI